MKRLLEHVLSVIRPSKEELSSEMRSAKLLLGHIQKSLPDSCRAVLTGSVAKQTFLRDKRDMDIFMLFDKSVPRDSLEGKIKHVMSRAFPDVGYQLSYAEHPYARFHFQGRRIDLVPAYKISKASERISAVDRSVLHTKFVLTHLKKERRGEVLLLKQFLGASGIYGAEIKIGGFSGYLCELLIIRYGSFQKLLLAASRWKTPLFIDLAGHHKGKRQVEEALGRFDSGFVVVDPTDKDRNVAAAVTDESFKRFISLSRAFLKKPSEDFFFRRPESFEEGIAKASKGGKAYLITMPRPSVVDDVLWGQLHKLMRQLKVSLEEYGPKRTLADDSRHLVRIAIVLEKDNLSAKMLKAGPPLDMKDHVKRFMAGHKRARFVKKKGQIFAEVKRPFTKADQALRLFFHSFSKGNSHLSYPEEMVIVEKLKA